MTSFSIPSPFTELYLVSLGHRFPWTQLEGAEFLPSFTEFWQIPRSERWALFFFCFFLVFLSGQSARPSGRLPIRQPIDWPDLPFLFCFVTHRLRLPPEYQTGPGFLGFHYGFLGFTMSYWVLLAITQFDKARVGFTGFYMGLTGFSLGFTWLYSVLLGFHSVLLGFTGFYWVFTRLYLVLLGFRSVLLGYIRFSWVLLGFTEFYWVLLGFIGFYRVLLGFHWVLLSNIRFYWVSLSFT